MEENNNLETTSVVEQPVVDNNVETTPVVEQPENVTNVIKQSAVEEPKGEKSTIIIILLLLIVAIIAFVLFMFVFNNPVKKAFNNFSKLNSYSIKVDFKGMGSITMSVSGATNTADVSGKFQHYTSNETYDINCYYDGERVIVGDVSGNKDQYINYFDVENPNSNSFSYGDDKLDVCEYSYKENVSSFMEELSQFSYSKKGGYYVHKLKEEESDEVKELLETAPFVVVNDHFAEKMIIKSASIKVDSNQVQEVKLLISFDEESNATSEIIISFSNQNKIEDKLPDEVVKNMESQIAGDWVGTYTAITDCSQIESGKYNNKLELSKNFDYIEGKSWDAKIGLCNGDIRTDDSFWGEHQDSYNYYIDNDEIIIFDRPFFDDEEDEIVAKGKINGDKIDLVYDYEGKKIEITLTKEK